MKVALCLSGQPRFYSGKSFESMKREILDVYDTDVFVHSWISKDENFSYPYARWSGINEKIVIPNSVSDDIVKLYKPKAIQIDEPMTFIEHSKDDYLSDNMPSMFYSMGAADTLRKTYSTKNSINYDFVIRARTDTLLGTLPDLTTFDNDKIYIPDNCPNILFLNDNFSIAGGEVADICYDIFNKIDEYSDEGTDYSPEKIWTIHLFDNKISFRRMNIYQNFVRSWN